jgi:16S rRNA (cytidine1402-2'-O)-methyltransferase
VSSPIGNIEDISFRALHILKKADIVLAEDSRVTGFLLKKYGIQKKIVSYFSRIENKKLDFVIESLKNGNLVALSIPGASSLIQGFVLSGFQKDSFFFQGFIPVKKSRNKTFEEFKKIKMPIVILESKYRIINTLKDILLFLGNVEIIIAREMTKKFEQVLRGKVKDILNKENFISKGEFVIVINKN